MNILSNYIPNESQSYCQSLIEQHSFKLILKKERATKLGDFRREKNGNYTITINRNLNQYQFLLTFIHEYAHLKAAVNHPKGTKAHGKEWKNAFRELMLPLLNPNIFPDSLLRTLAQHMRNPKATAASDPVLWKSLKAYDKDSDKLSLEDLNDGDQFTFRNKTFIRMEKRRTRFVCKHVSNSKLYLIPGIAEVDPH